jgi:superfamily II DNA/RNA helicase
VEQITQINRIKSTTEAQQTQQRPTTMTNTMSTSTSTSTSTILDPTETFETLFEAVGLDDRLRQAVTRLYGSGNGAQHVARPTLVQSKALPLAIASGRDLLVRSRTGSGKVTYNE